MKHEINPGEYIVGKDVKIYIPMSISGDVIPKEKDDWSHGAGSKDFSPNRTVGNFYFVNRDTGEPVLRFKEPITIRIKSPFSDRSFAWQGFRWNPRVAYWFDDRWHVLRGVRFVSDSLFGSRWIKLSVDEWPADPPVNIGR